MTDIFISYSRKDAEFVRQLHTALDQNGRDTWVDWEDIEYAEDWWQKIRGGIEESNSFIFVITPHSADSQVCYNEVEHALQNGKRIVPILVRSVETEAQRASLHSAINRHNWLPFSDPDAFAENIKTLLNTIDKDPDHVRMHTRLLIRARDWEQHQRNPSLLLMSDDLEMARNWLVEGLGKDPQPTQLQAEFIARSAGSAERRSRMRLAAALVAFMIAAGLALVAYTQFRQARANLVVSESERLVSEANRILESDRGKPEQVALLGLNAFQMRDSAQAYSVALRAAMRTSTGQIFIGHDGAVTSVAYAPDSRYLLTGGVDGTARLWDISTGGEIYHIEAHEGSVAGVVYSPDGRFLLTGGADQIARLWDANNGTLIREFKGHTDAVRGIAYSPDGRYVATASADSTARIWRASDAVQLHTITGHEGAVNAVAFSPDGTMLLTGGDDTTAHLWDVFTGQMLRIYERHSGPITSLTFMEDGLYFVTGSHDQTAVVHNIDSGEVLERLGGHTDWINSVAALGVSVLLGSDDQTVTLQYRGSTDRSDYLREYLAEGSIPAESHFNDHTGAVLGVAAAPDRSSAAIASADGTARIWRFKLSDEGFCPTSGSFPSRFSAAIARDGRTILLGADESDTSFNPFASGNLSDNWIANLRRADELDTQTISRQTILYTGSWPSIPLIGHRDFVGAVALSPDSRYALTGSEDRTARLWEVETGEFLREFSGHEAGVIAVALSDDHRYAATGSSDDTTRIWNLETGETIFTLTGHTGDVKVVTFSPDGRWLLTASFDATARLWDVQTGALIRTFSGHLYEIFAAAFSANGERIITGSRDQTARVWDTQTGLVRRVLTGHSNTVISVAFSPDSRLALTSGYDRNLMLWVADTGDLLESYETDYCKPETMMAVAFSPDGKEIISAQPFRSWEAGYSDLNAYVCARIYRDLTSDERAQFNLVEAEPICPPIVKPVSYTIQSAEIGGTPTPIILPIVAAISTPTSSPPPLMTPISPLRGKLFVGEIREGGDYRGESWTFTGRAGQMITISTSSQSDLRDAPDLILLDPYGEIIAENNGGLANIELPADGLYTVISRYWSIMAGSTPQYQISIADLEQTTATPPSRPALSATPIPLISTTPFPTRTPTLTITPTPTTWSRGKLEIGHQITAGAVPNAPESWSFDGKAGQNISVAVTATSQVFMELVAPDGVVYRSRNRGSIPSVRLDVDGEYTIALLAYAGYSYSTPESTPIIAYGLSLVDLGLTTATPMPTPTLSPTPVQRGAVIAGEAVEGKIEYDGRDVWMFSGRSGQIVSLQIESLEPETANVIFRASLRMPDNVQVAPLQTYGTDYRVPADGTYTVLVKGDYPDDVGRYRLGILNLDLTTATPTLTVTPYYTYTPTPEFQQWATVGTNPGQLNAQGVEIWNYEGNEGEVIALAALADNPVHNADVRTQREKRLLDVALTVYDVNQRVIAQSDDREHGLNTDAQINALILPVDGLYQIQVRSVGITPQGSYILMMTSE